MTRLVKTILLLSALAAVGGVSAGAAKKPKPGTHGPHTGMTVIGDYGEPGTPDGIDKLCRNHYNAIKLPVGKFEQIKTIIDTDKKSSVPELKAKLGAKGITLNEASWGLYYLGQKSLATEDFTHFVKYLTVAADDYLNPWAMTLLAKVYFSDKAAWQKQFPKAKVSTDKDLGKSYAYLNLAFALGGDIEKTHHDNAILTGVANGGLALKDTFEGTGVRGFDARSAFNKNTKQLQEKTAQYKKMYDMGR